VVERKWLASREVARRSVVPGAISEPSQIDELSAAESIYAGEQISTRRFRPLEEQGIQGQLKGNQRALQVAGDENQLLLGTLKNGDRVDVVGTWEFPEGSQTHVSRVVLRDLLVLQAPSTSKVESKLASSADGGYSATLAITDRQAHKLLWLTKNGEWSLDLRSAADAADSPESVDSSASLVADGLTHGQLRKGLNLVRRSHR
jgi:Flp pilus assembly protein CpaB